MTQKLYTLLTGVALTLIATPASGENLGLQLYSLRNQMSDDLPATNDGYLTLNSVSFSVEQTDMGGGRIGVAELSDVELIVTDQPAVAQLLTAMAFGTHISTAHILLGSGASGPIGEIYLDDVRVSSLEFLPSQKTGDADLVRLSLFAERFEFTSQGNFASFQQTLNLVHTCTLSTPLQFTHVTNAAGSAGGIPASHFSLAGSVVIPTTGSGGATGVPMFAVLVVATGFVPESACLFGAAAAGTVLPQVRLASYSPLNSVTPATEIELSSASVVKFTLATLPGGWVSVSSEFNYDAIELTATEINSDGIAGPSSTASYDLVSGTP